MGHTYQCPAGCRDHRGPWPASFTCPQCRLTSYHPDDVREGYCGHCHDWTGCPDPDHYRAAHELFPAGHPICGTQTGTAGRERIRMLAARAASRPPLLRLKAGPRLYRWLIRAGARQG